jgi:hypothetical protein
MINFFQLVGLAVLMFTLMRFTDIGKNFDTAYGRVTEILHWANRPSMPKACFLNTSHRTGGYLN